MKSSEHYAVAAASFAALAFLMLTATRAAEDSEIARGEYLVKIAGCSGCHTPDLAGNPDMTRYLGGSNVAIEIPGVGAYAGRNITPDPETGIGNWTADQIVTTLQTGTRPDGYQEAPIMNWALFASMPKEDVTAIAAYLRSIPAVKNQVAGPFQPGQKATTFLLRELPPGEIVAPSSDRVPSRP
jgi:mono/diheme cytochrome c family protein